MLRRFLPHSVITCPSPAYAGGLEFGSNLRYDGINCSVDVDVKI
jgi:hypothetical protein